MSRGKEAMSSATPIDSRIEADPVAIASAIAKEQNGRALLEVVIVGLLLLIPLVWALTVLSDLHRAGLAVAAAVHAAASDAARAPSTEAAARAVEAGAAAALRDHGIDPRTSDVTFSTSPGLRRGGEVVVRVGVPVQVGRAPLLGAVTGPSLWVKATGSRRLDLFRSRE